MSRKSRIVFSNLRNAQTGKIVVKRATAAQLQRCEQTRETTSRHAQQFLKLLHGEIPVLYP